MLHKFLAFPIIDRERRITGVVDVSLFNEEVFGIPKTESGDELFQAIGFHISQARQASPPQLFRFRFPWLLVTISAGTVCAFLTRAHEKTLQHTSGSGELLITVHSASGQSRITVCRNRSFKKGFFRNADFDPRIEITSPGTHCWRR